MSVTEIWLLTAGLSGGFGVWLQWSVISVLLLLLGAGHSLAGLFSLLAIAGLAGGTLRISLGFFASRRCARSFFWLSIFAAMLVAVATGWALNDPGRPLWQWQLLALLSGVGAGSFSGFFLAAHPERSLERWSLTEGLGTGVAHASIALSLALVPLLTMLGAWQVWGLEPSMLMQSSGHLLGGVASGSPIWPAFGSWLAGAVLALASLLGWLVAGWLKPVTPRRCLRFGLALVVGLGVAVTGMWLVLPAAVGGAGLALSPELTLALTVALGLMVLRALGGNRDDGTTLPLHIFNNKHTWLTSVLWMLSLGSFLGFAAVWPLLTQWLFGYQRLWEEGALVTQVVNPAAPGVFTYAWMGPLTGALMHPVGGWLAQRWRGPRVTQWAVAVMLAACVLLVYATGSAWYSSEPERYFLIYLLGFIVLFAAAGCSYGALRDTVLLIFSPENLRWIRLWLSAVAAFGVFYIPLAFLLRLESGPHHTLIGFAAFYLLCLLLNGWFYTRRTPGFVSH